MTRMNEADQWGPGEEAALRAAWVTEPPRLTGPVVVADYDPAWPALFEREAARLRDLLGAEIRLLEHVGSTSVPGLAAKPIIDILMVVPDPADERRYLPPLEQAGYRLVIREPGWHEHRALKGPDTNINLHVHGPSSPEVGRHLKFRDRLRADDADRELYQRTKRELAARDWTYIQQYADAKSAVVEEILSRS
jgi:GrpB-like predicted nucleotidyltransferase (UPF0157 family)